MAEDQARTAAHHAPGLSTSFPAHLHHGVVAEAPFGATQHRPSIDIDGPPTLIGNEEITIVFQLDDTYGNGEEKG